ncbi:homeobox-leucine zipper protein ATHB-17-like [Cucurbita maxima]|uniref:Homeobox-leucine zipper protein ATHB-17-like n=1 Tax=Cucurbita maxima TaxID=3661 RepID=A0A6J1K1T2_CUCMA|nr:homeobox-leucine zipper protein ATHB-17-like [Cucurbita maxima]
MAFLPINSSSLDLSISMPGFASSPPRPSAKELDMNRVPVVGEAAEEERAVAERTEEEEESCSINNGGGQPRKKLSLSKHQSRLLEDIFRHNHSLNPKQKEALAMALQLKPRQVEVWFQNRRARSKLKQTEMEYQYLRRWFGSLTEQNRRLRRELEELRAIKVALPAVDSSHGRQPPLPVSTITMCPQCKRVTAATITSSRAAATQTAIATTATPPKAVRSALKLQQPSQG